jgi:DNA-binding transcriptional MerR regulator
MKIGRFAASNNLSIDAVRYYMDLGLILPEKQGGQYNFDERCQSDLEDIINLKEMGFTLSEIKSIFLFKRLGKLTDYQKDTFYQSFYNNKLKEVSKKIDSLENIKGNLKQKIQELSARENKSKHNLGIDIKCLSIFRCAKCDGDLILGDGYITENKIISGRLRCLCGEEYIIDDGILIVGNTADAEEIDHNFIIDYINSTDKEYLNNIYTGLEWAHKRFDFSVINRKIALELGSGKGFFLRYIYSDIPDDSVYIAVDHDIKMHRFLKGMLENADTAKNIIFICSDFLELPIKDKLIDVLLDISGTSNYSFEHEQFLLDLVDHYVKDRAILLGGYIMFKKFASDSLVEEKNRKNFTLDHIKERIMNLGYSLNEERVSDFVEKGGKYESYFKKGEKVYTYNFYGKR